MTSAKRQIFTVLLACVLLMTTGAAFAAYTGDQSPVLEPDEANTVQVVKQTKASVVAISIRVQGKAVNPLKNMPPAMRQFFQQFMGGQMQMRKRTERAAGSGFVINENGEILTDYHVVASALKNDSVELKNSAKLSVQFNGGKKLPATVVGVDQSYDLALLKLKNPEQLPATAQPLELANSDEVKVGQKVIAIGNPFLLQSTVTQGIVSAINREQAAKVSGVPIEYIQTDAAINPGSSGGPLLNSQGEVIGVSDEILAPHGGFIGVGLAIPSNLVRDNLAKLEKGGVLKKAMIGIAIVALSDYPEDIRQQLHLPDHGLMIARVKDGSPGDKAGLHGAQFTIDEGGRPWPAGGDIILKADGKTLQSGRDIQDIVFEKTAGTEIRLLVENKGEKRHVTVTLQVLDSDRMRQESEP